MKRVVVVGMPTGSRVRRAAWLLVSLIPAACGGGSPTTPSTPASATPTKVFGVSGNLAFANVQVGSTANQNFTISNSGNTTLTISSLSVSAGLSTAFGASWTAGAITPGGSQQVTIQFAPTAAQAYSGTLTVNGDQTSGTSTLPISGTGTQPTPTGPRTQFGAGQYLVNTDIAAGRYYDAPTSACYWERESGLGGTTGEIIANNFMGFNAPQWIVDIQPSDKAFKTQAECGTWFKDSPRQGAQTNITQGMWLVGAQVSAGTYAAAGAQSGCYWERLRDFTGNLSGIIANNFASSAGQQLVTISSGDTGFDSNNSCGTWTKVSGQTTEAAADVIQSSESIRQNWELARQAKSR